MADKKESRWFVRAYTRALRPLWRRCFWTWPFGHDYTFTNSGVVCCLYCCKPIRVTWLMFPPTRGSLGERHDDLRSVFAYVRKHAKFQFEVAWPDYSERDGG